MDDLGFYIALFLLGTAFGLGLSEVFAVLSYRVRYRANKKRRVEPVLGVVLPKEEK